MKHRNIEYKILENTPKTKYKVKIRKDDFMGMPVWKYLFVVRERNLVSFDDKERYTAEPEHIPMCRYDYLATFTERNKAKQAAKDYIDSLFENEWYECKC